MINVSKPWGVGPLWLNDGEGVVGVGITHKNITEKKIKKIKKNILPHYKFFTYIFAYFKFFTYLCPQ